MSICNPQLELEPGTVIRKQFRIERELGRGAMGVVYLATQLDLDRPVAVKVFSIDDADVKNPDSLFNEARAAAALSHRNIVQVYSAGRAESGVGYFAMEYIAGKTVEEALQRDRRFEVGKALELGGQVASALRHGWNRLKLTHGDIKPDNVMLDAAGVAKLADFGLARAAHYEPEEEDLRLTPLYAAPELITDEWVKGDCRADMYSFGATLYHMIAGEPPFPGKDPQKVMERQVHEQPRSLSEMRPDCPAGLADFVAELLAKNPAERPESWQAVCARLCAFQGKEEDSGQGYLNASSPHLRRHRHPSGLIRPRKGPPRLLRTVLFLLFALGVLGAILSYRLRQQAMEMAPPALDRDEALPPPAAGAEEDSSLSGGAESDAESAGAETSSPANDDLNTARRLAEEREMAPSPDERSESLAEELEKVEEEGWPAGGDALGKPPDSEADENSVGSAGRALLAAEAYSEMLGGMVRSNWKPGAPVPRQFKAAAEEWIKTYGVEHAASAKVRFLKNRLLPAAGEYIHHLVLRHGKLKGESLPGARFEGETIWRVTSEGVETARILPFGRSSTKHDWAELIQTPSLMIYLGKLAFEDKSLPLTELRPYLSALFLAGAAAPLSTRLKAIDEGHPELPMWQALLEDWRGLETERRAMALWREAQETAVAGSARDSLRAIAALRRLDSHFAESHAEEIKALAERSYRSSPHVAAARQTEDILRRVDAQPAEALVRLGRLFANFGALEFPEKIDAVAARRKALEKLVQSPHYEAVLAQDNPALSEHGRYCLRTMREMLGEGDGAAPATGGQRLRYEAFRAGVLLEFGDWLGAVQVFPYSILAKNGKQISAPDRFHLGYTALRLAKQFSSGGPASSVDLALFDGIAHAWREEENKAAEAVVRALSLGLECGRHSFGDWKTGRRPAEIEPWAYLDSNAQQQHMLQIAWMLMHGYRQEAAKLAAQPIGWFDRAAKDDLPEGPFIPFARRLHGALNEGEALDLSHMPLAEHPLTAPFWRAAISVILSRDPASIWQRKLPNPEAMAVISGSGPLQASLWSDWAVLRLGGSLGRRDMAAAAEQIQALLLQIPRDVLPFRTELRFYHVGIELMRKRRAAAIDLLNAIKISGLAAAEERLLAAYWAQRLAGSGAGVARPPTSRRVVYYHLWLTAADLQSGQSGSQRSRALKHMADRALTPARAAFCRNLAAMFGAD